MTALLTMEVLLTGNELYNFNDEEKDDASAV
jgi:hypothetical protein